MSKDLEKLARSIVDTLGSEFYTKVVVGIGTSIVGVKDLARSFKEVNRPSFKDLPQEHVAEGGRELIDQTGNPQVVIADDSSSGHRVRAKAPLSSC